jgi:hypothetical protein
VLAALCSCATTREFAGPLAVRNQHPVQLLGARPLPRSAAAQPAHSASVDWNSSLSSYFLSGTGGGGTFVMDGEMLRTALGARIGLGHGFDLAFEVPVLHASGGFLDRFVIDWHDTFGFADQGRSSVPRDDYLIEARGVGAPSVWRVEPHGARLGDVPIELSYTLVDPQRDGFGLALRGGVELPTGDSAAGFGSGGVDLFASVVGEWRLHAVALTAQFGWTSLHTSDAMRDAGISLDDGPLFDLGAEVLLTDRLGLLALAQFDTAGLGANDFGRVTDDQWLLWFGLRQRLGSRSHLEFGLGEDLSRYVAADFTAFLNFRFAIGPTTD